MTASKRRALKSAKATRLTASEVIRETAKSAGVRVLPKAATGLSGLLGALVRNARAELGAGATIEVLMARYSEHVAPHLPALGVELSDERAREMMVVMIDAEAEGTGQWPS